MTDKTTLTGMSDEEFDGLIDQFIERGEDKVAPSTFLQVMADLAEQHKQREIELTATVVNGDLVFDTPAPLPVGTNTLYVGDTKVILRLRLAG